MKTVLEFLLSLCMLFGGILFVCAALMIAYITADLIFTTFVQAITGEHGYHLVGLLK
jgi:hypothetical protein